MHSEIAFLDHAATTQKPRAVSEAIAAYLSGPVSNPHRTHTLDTPMEAQIEALRTRLAHAVGDREKKGEILLSSGATTSSNLLAFGLRHLVHRGDVVFLSPFEHHATWLSWKRVCEERGAMLQLLPYDGEGSIDLHTTQTLLDARVKIVVCTHASNVLGSVLPLKALGEIVHANGAWLISDAAQSVPHHLASTLASSVDACFFSAHKWYGPSGIGAAWVHHRLLPHLEPVVWGGGMTRFIAPNESVELAEAPACFEAGTLPLEGIVGWNAALQYLDGLPRKDVEVFEREMDARIRETLVQEGAELFPSSPERVPVTTFTVSGLHDHDLATVLATRGVWVRAGQQCASSVYRLLGRSSGVRVSLGLTTRAEDVERLISGIQYAKKILT